VKHTHPKGIRAGHGQHCQGEELGRAWWWRPGRIPAGSVIMSDPTDRMAAAAPQVLRGELAARVFRALYPDFELRTVDHTHVVVPRGTPWYAGRSLGELARQISGHAPQPAGRAGR
jgi:hypothetical protein